MTDKQRLDWLERFVKRDGGLVLHNGKLNRTLPYAGLAFPLGPTRRNLREAIDACCRFEKRQPATKVGENDPRTKGAKNEP